MPKKYVVKTQEGTTTHNSYRSVKEFVDNYLSKRVRIKPEKEARMITNITKGLKVWTDIEMDKKVLVKVYKGKKLIDVITEKEVYIDAFISSFSNEIQDTDVPSQTISFINMILNMSLDSLDILDEYTFKEVRTALFMNIVGIIHNAVNGSLYAHVVTQDDENPEEYRPSIKTNNKDIERMYR